VNRADIDTERVYRCTTSFQPDPNPYQVGRIIGLCKVVEIPASGGDVLVRQVNGRLEPQGKTIAARLSDIKVAGEHDIERAIRDTRVQEADLAWAKLAKEVRADYNRLLKALKLTGKVELAESIPYAWRHGINGKSLPTPDKITRAMVENTVSISIKGPDFAKAMDRLKVAQGPAVRKALDERVIANRRKRSVYKHGH
jgi:hypothetical protein